MRGFGIIAWGSLLNKKDIYKHASINKEGSLHSILQYEKGIL